MKGSQAACEGLGHGTWQPRPPTGGCSGVVTIQLAGVSPPLFSLPQESRELRHPPSSCPGVASVQLLGTPSLEQRHMGAEDTHPEAYLGPVFQ